MRIIETNSVTSMPENTCKSSQSENRQVDQKLGHELLMTSALTVIGTAALVGMHHRQRKQSQPDASLQDYVSGIRSQGHLLRSASKRQLTRLRYACQQTTQAWKRAYQTDSLADKNKNDITNSFSAVHTTIILPRPVCWVSSVASMPKNITVIKNENDTIYADDFGVVGIDADRKIVWQTTMPERVHDIVVQPLSDPQNKSSHHSEHNNEHRHVVVMGRRPSEKFWVLDTATGQVKYATTAADNRHFYGHACYSLDSSKLYVTESDTISLTGKIGIYDACDNYKKIAEFDSHGVGPHELIMHPDGETLVIANGGIKTEQASREELNLDTMNPSLVYLNRHDGTLLEQITPEHTQMSVRHLAMHDDGTVMIGIQFQGERHINVPLVLTHKRGDTRFSALTMPNNQWQRFHQYIASVAVDSERNQLCVTTPIGGCAAIFDLTTRTLIDAVNLLDCAGASVMAGKMAGATNSNRETLGFMVSDGQGQLTTLRVNEVSTASLDSSDDNECVHVDSKRHKMSFDNHLQVL